MPFGNYEFNSRMLHPVTGSLLGEDTNPFAISGTAVTGDALQSAASAAPPRLDITLSKFGDYSEGDTVSATSLRMSNPGSAVVAAEVKAWLGNHAGQWSTIINVGANGSFSFPAGLDMELRPLWLLVVSFTTPRSPI
jgi:hypothetical protein